MVYGDYPGSIFPIKNQGAKWVRLEAFGCQIGMAFRWKGRSIMKILCRGLRVNVGTLGATQSPTTSH